MLLAALTVVVLMFCELAATSGRLSAWVAAGVFAGFAILTNFYGWFTLGFAVLAAVIWLRSWHGLRMLAISTVVAGVVAAPWLIRNLVRLGDPVYPIGSPIFHGFGLVQPLWNAAQAEIRQNAVGQQFGDARGLILRSIELAVALESSYLLPCGLTLGLLVGLWRSWFHDLRALYLSAAVLLLIGGVLAPGWYWLRALLPIMPVGALLTGLALDSARQWAQIYRDSRGILAFGASLWTPVLVAAGLLSFTVSLSLSFAGPTQGVWTTKLAPSSDFMRSVRNLGSKDAQVFTDFGGDYPCWQWLNSHLGPRDKVATFEIRVYYINRPLNLFYLDGLEAVPLLHLHTVASVRQYLIARDVRYIMIPAWAIPPTPTRHPAVDLLPLMQMLGKPNGFSVVEQFGPTKVYSVMPPGDGPVAALAAGYGSIRSRPGATSLTFPRRPTMARGYGALLLTGAR
jgi:hypothetical protein